MPEQRRALCGHEIALVGIIVLPSRSFLGGGGGVYPLDCCNVQTSMHFPWCFILVCAMLVGLNVYSYFVWYVYIYVYIYIWVFLVCSLTPTPLHKCYVNGPHWPMRPKGFLGAHGPMGPHGPHGAHWAPLDPWGPMGPMGPMAPRLHNGPAINPLQRNKRETPIYIYIYIYSLWTQNLRARLGETSDYRSLIA